MVEVKYIGNLGNRLFQYCLGRIIAETLGFGLQADPITGFSGTKQVVPGREFPDGRIQELTGQKIDLRAVLKDRSPRKILLKGYFQRYEYYQPFKDMIRKQWLVPDLQPREQRSGDEMVLNIRRGDYIQMGWATPFAFFRNVLASARCEKVSIVTDQPDDPFFRRFRAYEPKLFHEGPLEDFACLLGFKRIVISESTFSWWAAFLSEAEEVIVPRSARGPWSGAARQFDVDMRVNLEVVDEARFKLMPVRESYRPNPAEFVFNARHYRARFRDRWNRLKRRLSPRAAAAS